MAVGPSMRRHFIAKDEPQLVIHPCIVVFGEITATTYRRSARDAARDTGGALGIKKR